MNDPDALSLAMVALQMLCFANMIPLSGRGAYARFILQVKIPRKTIWLLLALLPVITYAAIFGIASYKFILNNPSSLDHNAEKVACATAALTTIVPAVAFRDIAKYTHAIKDAKPDWERWLGALPDSLIDLCGTLSLGKNVIVSSCVASAQFALFYSSCFDTSDTQRETDSELILNKLSQDYGYAFVLLGATLACLILYRSFFNPSRIAAERSLSYFVLARPHEYRIPSITSIYVGRWRSRQHKNAFRAAASLGRSISGLRAKLTKEDFEEINEVARHLGHLMKKRSIWLADGRFDEEYGELSLAALSLIVSRNPVHACQIAKDLTAHVEPPELANDSKVALFLDALDSAIQRYSRLMMIALGFAVFVLLLFTGQLAQALDFLRAVVLPGA